MFSFKVWEESNMKIYTVFGKVIVEVSMKIEAENLDDALKIANESGKTFSSFEHSGRVYSDEPIEWNYVEETII